MRNRLPTRTFLAHGRQHVDSHCPRCNAPETTLHILRDCPWVRVVWAQSPGILPFSFYHMPLMDWLRYNATLDRTILSHKLLWRTYFPFTCWKLWIARNERIFKNQSRTQHNLLYSSVQVATEYHFLAGTISQPPSRIPHLVRWYPPPPQFPYLKLNTDGSALGNPRPAGAGGVLRDHRGQWITGFSLHGGFASNNMDELAAVKKGLEMAWNKGYKLLHLELDSKVVLSWLTNQNMNYPTNLLPLICDCRNLLHQEREVHVHHVYREANGCADLLAKRGTRQQPVECVYSSCPTFRLVSH